MLVSQPGDKRLSMIVAAVLIFSLFCSIVLPAPGKAAGEWPDDAAGKRKLLIIYNDESEMMNITILQNLAGHFAVQTLVVPLEKATTAMTEQADFVIITSPSAAEERDAAEKILYSLQRPVLWIGEPPGAENRGATLLSTVTYTYSQQSYTEWSSQVYRLPEGETLTAGSTVIAEASDGYHTIPLLLANGNQWYFLSTQLFGFPGKILEDALHEFFNEPHAEEHEGFIRIEDVHPAMDPEKLIKVADLLAARNIPFMVAVIPVYVDSKTGREIHAGQRPEFVHALKYMAERGGSMIMHGYTHQYRQQETGEGFEFWDIIRDAPIENEESYMKDKIERGIASLVYLGLSPVAFEAPHYSMSQNGYKILGKYFSTTVAQIQISDQSYLHTQEAHYRMTPEHYGLQVIPETIGYVENSPVYPEKMRYNIDKVLLVRDSVIGGFFHPYLPLEKLEELLNILQEYPLRYIDLKSEPNRVWSDFVEITSGPDGIQVNVTDSGKLAKLGAPPPPEEKNVLAAFSNKVSWLIAILVLTFIILLLYLLLRLKRSERAAIFAERETMGGK